MVRREAGQREETEGVITGAFHARYPEADIPGRPVSRHPVGPPCERGRPGMASVSLAIASRLVATWRRKCSDLSEAAVRRVLEQLLHPPHFHLPPARVAHTRHYMPWEKKGPADRTMVFDTFVAVGRSNPLIAHWPDATLSPDEALTLSRLAENLSTLGRAEGWVHAEPLQQASIDWNCTPSAAAGLEQELVSVFCPDPVTAFGDEHYPPPPDAKKLKKGLKPNEYLFDCPRWHLCLDTEIIHAERWPRVPGARWVSYARQADAFTKPAGPVARQNAKPPQWTGARFLLDGPVLPLVTDTVRVAEAFRAVAMSYFNAWCHKQPPAEVEQFRRTDRPDQYASQIISGKDANGRFLPGHDHAHYLPTAEGDDPRRLTHVTIYARRWIRRRGDGGTHRVAKVEGRRLGTSDPVGRPGAAVRLPRRVVRRGRGSGTSLDVGDSFHRPCPCRTLPAGALPPEGAPPGIPTACGALAGGGGSAGR